MPISNTFTVNNTTWSVPSQHGATQTLQGVGAGNIVTDEIAQTAWNEALSLNGQINHAYEKIMRATKDRSTSRWSDEYRALEERLKEIQESLYRESEELAGVLEQQAKLAEVVRDTASIVRQHITTLSQVSTQIEKRMQTLRPQDSPETETKPSAKRPAHSPSPPLAEVGEAEFGLEP